MTACIVGWSHTPFGKHDSETVESLIVRVTNEALASCGDRPQDVDEIVLGHYNAGFTPQDFTASLVLQADDGFRFKPATRVENACATGSAAVHQAIKTIEAKRARVVLVVGVEQMTRTPGPEIGRTLLKASYLPEDGDNPAGFAGVFGNIAGAYFQRHGDQSDALAMIAAKNHHNGVQNPYAQMRKDLASRSAAPSRTRTRSWRARSSAPIARWSRTAPRRSCSPTPRRRSACAAPSPSGPTPTRRTSCRCRSATS